MIKKLSSTQIHLISFGGLFVVSLILSLIYFNTSKKQIVFLSAALNDERGEVLATQSAQLIAPADPNQKILTILLLGYGGAGHQGGFLADVIMVAHFDFDKKILGLISIPRDTYFQNKKINGYLNPSQKGVDASTLKSVIAQITGLPIQYFIGIDFVGFQRLIGENLKSIQVNIPQDFEDPWYPIRGEEVNPCGKSPEEIAQLSNSLSGFALEKEFPCRYEHIIYQKGPRKMEGGEALKYVRSRHSSSDFDRSERQKTVLIGARDKLFSLESLSNIDSFYAAISKNVSSDVDLDVLKNFIPLLQTSQELEVKSVTLSTQNVFNTSSGPSGEFILVPKTDWQGVSDFIRSGL